ncbi:MULTISPECIES: acyl-CoA thioesterase [Deefgea]|uniref:Esterase n=1 Tax=Deefgea chitinilytica TaxID=570276 RepID=A0ABS2C870_9NEIS|nr:MULTISPECIES: thioesterase family protein [Deefgea]MBM5570339.1 esterase [Deefgea chitinilytica]MBM9887568.1 acyl-CoA thioesterase [Deefgea sp. CFH1-16]
MPRIKLELPACTLFECEIAVRISDINYGNHLANDALLGLLHEARLQWLRSLGFQNELDLGGAGLILCDASLVFLHEAFYGDLLHIRLAVDEISRAGFELYYDVTTQDRSIAKAKTSMASFSYTKRKIISLPESFRQILVSSGALVS